MHYALWAWHACFRWTLDSRVWVHMLAHLQRGNNFLGIPCWGATDCSCITCPGVWRYATPPELAKSLTCPYFLNFVDLFTWVAVPPSCYIHQYSHLPSALSHKPSLWVWGQFLFFRYEKWIFQWSSAYSLELSGYSGIVIVLISTSALASLSRHIILLCIFIYKNWFYIFIILLSAVLSLIFGLF